MHVKSFPQNSHGIVRLPWDSACFFRFSDEKKAGKNRMNFRSQRINFQLTFLANFTLVDSFLQRVLSFDVRVQMESFFKLEATNIAEILLWLFRKLLDVNLHVLFCNDSVNRMFHKFRSGNSPMSYLKNELYLQQSQKKFLTFM